MYILPTLDLLNITMLVMGDVLVKFLDKLFIECIASLFVGELRLVADFDPGLGQLDLFGLKPFRKLTIG